MSGASEHDKDAKVRRALAERFCDDGSTPRPTSFFFYDGDFEGLASAAAAAGYEVRTAAKEDGTILERVISVDEQSFAAHSAQMEVWASRFGCTYDGWECEVVEEVKH